MTTPDPKANNAPFEWSALTINKVERIQLERLHQEQDRIEREAREHEARARAAHERAQQERDREALEHAWFEDGDRGAAALEGEPTPPPGASPSERRMKSLPPPKPRVSQPPRRKERPLSAGLVLAACAFGGSVYFSLRWVAQVRQAHVTQQLSSTKNATVPAPLQTPNALTTQTANRETLTPNPTALGSNSSTSPALNIPPSSPTSGEAPRVNQSQTPNGSSRLAAPAPKNAPTPDVTPVEPLPESLPVTSDQPASVPSTRGRLLVPRAGTPVTQGARVYRAGD